VAIRDADNYFFDVKLFCQDRVDLGENFSGFYGFHAFFA
jgi:hypothetical protein